jgi:hypothetical protein
MGKINYCEGEKVVKAEGICCISRRVRFSLRPLRLGGSKVLVPTCPGQEVKNDTHHAKNHRSHYNL